MGNRTNLDKPPLRPSSLARSDPTADTSQRNEVPPQKEVAKEAKSTVIKVLGSPQHARKSVQSAVPGTPSPVSKLVVNPNVNSSRESSEVRSRPARGPKFVPNGRASKRGSVGPASRSSSQERVSSPNSSLTQGKSALETENLRIAASAIASARQRTEEYKEAVLELFEDWEGRPQIAEVDAFLSLDTELTHYMGRIFSLAQELQETQFQIADVMFCGVHFLWSCRNEPGDAVELKGTPYEGRDDQYFNRLQSFFNLVSKDLDFANLGLDTVKVGKVVDFQDTEFSRKAIAAVGMLQRVFDKILDHSVFGDF